MEGYASVQEMAARWGVTPRQVQLLCKEDRIAGASKISKVWVIPSSAEKPTMNLDLESADKRVNVLVESE